MAVNLELKASDPDPAATAARAAALGAADRGVLRQRDTYFASRHGRLKLRQPEGGDAELIAYRRGDALQAAESSYVRVPVSDPGALSAALEQTLGTRVVVSKRRRLLSWENARIHLDEVEDLGTFIEIEIVEPDERAPAQMARLREALGIDDAALVAGGYADLLIDGAQSLLRAADAAMRNAYAPYSSFKVGAAVRARSGAIYAGANVENVAFPQGACAEASALGALVTAGETAITAVAVVAEKLEHCPPCGGCRQRLAEFGDPATPVHLGRPGHEPSTVTLGELLPGAFSRGDLEA
ncbi:MAG TPA: cytidine deaminase [Solirubrobacteraceae bacterium]|nr:cytidine deaminase [Solirubrobacteraceae bacterium]